MIKKVLKKTKKGYVGFLPNRFFFFFWSRALPLFALAFVLRFCALSSKRLDSSHFHCRLLVNFDDQLVEQFVDEDDFLISIDFDNQMGHFDLVFR